MTLARLVRKVVCAGVSKPLRLCLTAVRREDEEFKMKPGARLKRSNIAAPFFHNRGLFKLHL